MARSSARGETSEVERRNLDDTFVLEKRQRVSDSLVAQVMMGASEDGPSNEWVSRYELTLLRQLTGLPICAARLHRAPRKRFIKPPKMVLRSRLTIMIGRDPVDAFVVSENPEEVAANPRHRSSIEWKIKGHGYTQHTSRVLKAFMRPI